MSEDLGVRNPSAGIGLCGLSTTGVVRHNFREAELVELAVSRGEATLTAHGALRALTGQHTGRTGHPDFIARCAEGLEDVKSTVAECTPEWAAEIGIGMIANFHGTTGAAKKDLVGGTYNLSNLTGTTVVRASWDTINQSGSRGSNTAMRLADSNGSFLSVGQVIYNGGLGRNLGLLVTTNTGATDYIDLNSDIAPNTRTGPDCSPSTATTGS